MTRKSAKISHKHHTLVLSGLWNINGIDSKQLTKTIDGLSALPDSMIIDAHNIGALDTIGAWEIHKLSERLTQHGIKLDIKGLNKANKKLLNYIQRRSKTIIEVPKAKILNPIAQLGLASINYLQNFFNWFSFVGEVFINICQSIAHPSRIRWKYFFNIIEVNGYHALPIIGFLTFLIGIVLTYQIGLELRSYGANIFIIPLLGLAIFREFAPLITAIIVSGRSGSAFTAQLGIMKSNEEIDALRTLGHSPTVMLVLPRVFGLVIAMPLLTIWADIFGILGGMTMSSWLLDIGYHSFLTRFPAEVTFTTFMIGMIKAPVFAMIIATVGCFHGFRVTGSSESIGWETTKSVVLAIFLIIIADAFFSIVLGWLNI